MISAKKFIWWNSAVSNIFSKISLGVFSEIKSGNGYSLYNIPLKTYIFDMKPGNLRKKLIKHLPLKMTLQSKLYWYRYLSSELNVYENVIVNSQKSASAIEKLCQDRNMCKNNWYERYCMSKKNHACKLLEATLQRHLKSSKRENAI